METVKNKVRSIIAEQLGIEIEKVKEEASLEKDFNADSLDAVEILMELEEAFEVSISDEDARKFATVNEIVEYITNETEKKKVS